MVTNTTELMETGEKRDRLGRKITPRERRRELVATWRQSGITQAAFARREGVNYTSFASWVQAERREQSRVPVPSGTRPAPVRFAEVRLPGNVPAAAGGLEVRLPDGTLLRGGSAAELAKLVRALRA